MKSIDSQKLRTLAREGRDRFTKAEPYEQIVFDDFFEPAVANDVLAEFQATSADDKAWKSYHHYNEKKRAVSREEQMGPATRALFDDLKSPEFLAFLEELTGVKGLLWDPHLDGAGLHETKPGGFLNVHVDFLAHTTRKTWSRQLNLILFLNKDWEDAYNGELELWDEKVETCVERVKPIFNRVVLFHTGPTSYHGVPKEVLCPEGMTRKSIALYYFREEGIPLRLKPTFYRPRPSDSPKKRVLIYLDRTALRVYSVLKRYTGVSDEMVCKVLDRIF